MYVVLFLHGDWGQLNFYPGISGYNNLESVNKYCDQIKVFISSCI